MKQQQQIQEEQSSQEIDIDNLTDEELQELAEMTFGEDDKLSTGLSPKMKEKQDIMAFFNNVLERNDTTKVSNLSDEELQAVRLMQRAALYSLTVEYIIVAKYIKKRAEILLASGLSGKEKGGFFLKIINTQKKMLESLTKRGTSEGSKKGWFGGRNKE